jgi:hypothetical protein
MLDFRILKILRKKQSVFPYLFSKIGKQLQWCDIDFEGRGGDLTSL